MESFLVASGVRHRTRPVLVTPTAHACLGGGVPQEPKAGVLRALTGACVAGGLVTLPQAMRVSAEPAASRRRAMPGIMSIRRGPACGRCTAAVTK